MSKLARFRYLPTRRLALVVALSSPIWILSQTQVGIETALSVTALIVVLTLADALAIPGKSALHVKRQVPRIVGTGETAIANYEIESSWPLTLHARLHHNISRALSCDASEHEIILKKHDLLEITVEIKGQIRGYHSAGNSALTICGPLQLVKRIIVQPHDDYVTVIPGTPGLPRYRLMTIQRRMRATGQRAIKALGSSTTFAGLRDYVPGDDPRYVDWKATARRERLMVRDFTIEQGQTVMIAVDAGRMMAQMHQDRSRFEHVLSSALTLASVASASGDRVGLIVFNDEVRGYVPPLKGDTAIKGIRETLTQAQPTLAESDYAAAFRTMAAKHRRRSLIVFFTDVIDPRSSRAVIAHTVRSGTKHLMLVVALQNDALMKAAAPEENLTGKSETKTGKIFENVAAEELVLARQEALLAMQQAGVSIVDTPMAGATTALVNAYLDIKAKSGL